MLKLMSIEIDMSQASAFKILYVYTGVLASKMDKDMAIQLSNYTIYKSLYISEIPQALQFCMKTCQFSSIWNNKSEYGASTKSYYTCTYWD